MTPLMNRARAETVLAEAGVAALVLADPTNIYHATGFWPRTLEMGHLGSTLAVVVPDAAVPPVLITPQFLHYFQSVGALAQEGALEILLHTAPDEAAPGGAADPFFFRTTADGEEDAFERATRSATLGALAATRARPSAAEALRDTLSKHGVRGRIATDGYIPQAMLGEAAFAFVPAEPLLRRIRMIKSAPEIALMRRAARDNAAAARAAVAAMTVGDRYEDLRNAYFAETGRRGGLPVFLDVDSASYEQRDGTIRDGRCFMIDAVARYDRYHGDYGRTIFVGTPDPVLARAMDAAMLGARAVAEALAPGMHYSDVTRIGREAITAAGLDVLIAASPHSVGLFHTDEAFAGDGLTFAKADHLIEKDMVLSIDCPVLDTDLGGTVHLEDLWLVTESGCEPLNDTADPFLRI